MVGSERPLSPSLRKRLSLGMSAIIMGAALIGGTVSYYSSQHEAQELQDDVLRQVASLFKQQHWITADTSNENYKKNSDAESHLYVQFIDPSGAPVQEAKDAPLLQIPANTHKGMQSLLIGDKSYRVFVSDIGQGRRIVVAQETAVRDEIGRNSALSTLIPFLLLVPMLVSMTTILIRRVFNPVSLLAAEIEQRTEQDLHSIAGQNIPIEVLPFIRALNKLLEKIKASVHEQRRFIADAAHELRTPLTALSLQAERLDHADMPSDVRERVASLRQGIQRSRHLLEQLLSMARAQTENTEPAETVSAHRLLLNALEELLPVAESKGIDMGIANSADIQLVGSELEWGVLLRNLVNNAISYTQNGGRVDLSVLQTDNSVLLIIEDNGPGIAEEQCEFVFEPFYRIAGNDVVGSGLGLSIASAIAQKFGAEIRLEFTDTILRTGLRVIVKQPKTFL